MLGRLRLLWHRRAVRRKMDRVFGRGRDPYGYQSAPYELGRLSAMEEALRSRLPDGGRFRRALEVGSAEGAFTRRLVPLAESVTAVELSPVALARAREAAGGAVEWVEADVRDWSPPAGVRYDAVVLADVLYYLDKPLVRREFEAFFPRAAAWLSEGGALLLAHAVTSPEELALRRGYRERFEAAGLRLLSEREVGSGGAESLRCLVSLLSS